MTVTINSDLTFYTENDHEINLYGGTEADLEVLEYFTEDGIRYVNADVTTINYLTANMDIALEQISF